MLQMSIGKRLFPFCPAVQRDRVHTSFYSLFMIFLTNGVILCINASLRRNMFLFCFFLSARDPAQTIRLPWWTACGSQRPVSRSEVSLTQRASAQKGPGLTASDPQLKERIHAKRTETGRQMAHKTSPPATSSNPSWTAAHQHAQGGLKVGSSLSSFYKRDAVRAAIFSNGHIYMYIYIYIYEGGNGAALYWASQSSKITFLPPLPHPPFFFSFHYTFFIEGDYLSVLFTHPCCVHQMQVQINQKYACSTVTSPRTFPKRLFLSFLLGDWATESY